MNDETIYSVFTLEDCWDELPAFFSHRQFNFLNLLLIPAYDKPWKMTLDCWFHRILYLANWLADDVQITEIDVSEPGQFWLVVSQDLAVPDKSSSGNRPFSASHFL
jgi:hypothetical protein